MTTKQRRADLDIAKGIGILLVVWAHAKAPYNSYMYLFHMPFFFLISGYLHNHKAEFGTFFKRKVVSLYLPFVGWNLAVTVLKLLENPHRWKASMQTMVEILLALEKDGEFFGATWFLASLFWVAVIYKAGETLLSRYSWGPTALDLAFVGAGGFSIYRQSPLHAEPHCGFGPVLRPGCGGPETCRRRGAVDGRAAGSGGGGTFCGLRPL